MKRNIVALLLLLVGGCATTPTSVPTMVSNLPGPATHEVAGKFLYYGDSIAWGLEFTVEGVSSDGTLKISDSSQRYAGQWTHISISGRVDSEGIIHISNWAGGLTLRRQDNGTWLGHWGNINTRVGDRVFSFTPKGE